MSSSHWLAWLRRKNRSFQKNKSFSLTCDCRVSFFIDWFVVAREKWRGLKKGFKGSVKVGLLPCLFVLVYFFFCSRRDCGFFFFFLRFNAGMSCCLVIIIVTLCSKFVLNFDFVD